MQGRKAVGEKWKKLWCLHVLLNASLCVWLQSSLQFYIDVLTWPRFRGKSHVILALREDLKNPHIFAPSPASGLVLFLAVNQ
jgi:hypothetical protein